MVLEVPCTLAYSSHLAEELWGSREKRTDFKLKTGDGTHIPCHSIILAANSPVLKAAVFTDMKEASVGEMSLEDYNHDVVLAVVKYMYTGSTSIADDQLMDVTCLCDYLDMSELHQHCSEHATQTLTPANVIGWMKLAALQKLEHVIIRANELLESSFREISFQSQFLALSLAEILECIKHSTAKQVNCDDLVKGIFRWIDHKQEERVSALSDLIQTLGLQNCSAKTMEELQSNYSTILDRNNAFYKHHYRCCLEQRRECDVDEQAEIAVLGGEEGQREVLLIDEQFLFTEISRFPETANRGLAVCSTEFGLVVSGGFCQLTKHISKVFLFIPSSNHWKQLQSMQKTRNFHACVYIGSVVYLLGGYYGGWVCSAEQLTLRGIENLDTERWQEAPQIPKAVVFPKACSLHGIAYLMGDDSSHLYAYDPSTRQWGLRAQLPISPGSQFSMAATSDSVFIAGGTNKRCASYFPAANCWSVISNEPTLTHLSGAMVMRGRTLVLLGGLSAHVEEYDPDKRVWTVCDAKMPNSGRYHHAVILQ